jgi:hypothetical protein
MPQLHFYVPDEIAKRIKEKAKARNMSVSKFVAETMQRETHLGWPEGYFEQVVGKWQGEPLERPEQLPLEERDPFD